MFVPVCLIITFPAGIARLARCLRVGRALAPIIAYTSSSCVGPSTPAPHPPPSPRPPAPPHRRPTSIGVYFPYAGCFLYGYRLYFLDPRHNSINTLQYCIIASILLVDSYSSVCIKHQYNRLQVRSTSSRFVPTPCMARGSGLMYACRHTQIFELAT